MNASRFKQLKLERPLKKWKVSKLKKTLLQEKNLQSCSYVLGEIKKLEKKYLERREQHFLDSLKQECKLDND